MARPELGIKRTCPTTGRKFYDLNKNPVVSPYSGEVVPNSVLTPFSKGAAPIVARKEAPPEEEDDAEVGGPELVSLDEVEAKEADKDTEVEADEVEGEDIVDDDETVDDDTLVVDEDDDDAESLVDVEGDDED